MKRENSRKPPVLDDFKSLQARWIATGDTTNGKHGRQRLRNNLIKFMFSKKATKIDEIFTFNLTLCSKSQIDGEDFVNFCGLLRKHKL